MATAKEKKGQGFAIVRKAAPGEVLTPRDIKRLDPFTYDIQSTNAGNDPGGPGRSRGVLEPPYNPVVLWWYFENSPHLAPCVEAMVTNVDGTGFKVDQDEDKDAPKADPASLKVAQDFFKQPWPGQSFVTSRKDFRRDLEFSGNGYFEVLRNTENKIALVRRLDTQFTRLTNARDPVVQKVGMPHLGEGVEVDVVMYPRVYVTWSSDNQLIYMKEFGVDRQLDAVTGAWVEEGKEPEGFKPATEVIHFRAVPHSSGYGIPRWVQQTPSVTGARKAELQNNYTFDSGGVPPMIIFVMGGTLSQESTRAIREILNSPGKHKAVGAVLDVEATEGSIESGTSNTKVLVERFGAERQSDSMFENYILKSEERVRASWRIPPIFVGQAVDYNYATAQVSYAVGEAQVFRPERDEFDEVMNLKLLPALVEKPDGIVFKSNPVSITDPAQQLLALGQAKDVVTRESYVDAVNEVGHLDLEMEQPPKIPGLLEDGTMDPAFHDQGPLDEDGNPTNPPPTPVHPPEGDGVHKPAPGGKLPPRPPAQKPAQTQKSDVDVPYLIAKEIGKAVNGLTQDPRAVTVMLQHSTRLSKGDRERLKQLVAHEMNFPVDAVDLIEGALATYGRN